MSIIVDFKLNTLMEKQTIFCAILFIGFYLLVDVIPLETNG